MLKQRKRLNKGLVRDPMWYKTAVIYEVHIRAFCDSNGDGIGDLPGLTSKLDYLADLGVTAIWLLPFYPSPLRDGGYDIADYTAINPAYGTMDDFKRLLEEAHLRGLRVITEVVINHTSVEHAWFQKARRAPAGSPERDFYVWREAPSQFLSARIIFKDFETSNWAWDPVAKAYYWHRFYSHQPDLNFDNPKVHDAVLEVVDFWLGMGVDGLRLDAIPYLYEREDTTCENLPETHAFLRKLRAHVDGRFQDKMLLAEANQWPADAASYFGEGNECHMNFHFPLMPRMFMALHMEDRFPIVDILHQTPPVPDSCQWALFLRNHDELTLEMVTDEERDYMYRVYTEDPVARINLGIRRRLGPLLKSRRKVEMLNGLLFSLPGTPVLYYGDEIGMGDNIYLGDRDGVRTPMQWSGDRNAGFSRSNPQRLYLPVVLDPEYHYEAVNVEAQQANASSLLWWMKRLISLRKEHPVFGSGATEILQPDNPRILAFLRQNERERVLVVANLSRYTQYVELDLTKHAGTVPVELFGRTPFPVVTERPYPLVFGPHGFYWFALESPRSAAQVERAPLRAEQAWTAVASDRAELAVRLANYASDRRWFRGKSRAQQGAQIADIIELTSPQIGHVLLVVLEIAYTDADSESYLIPMAFAAGESATYLAQSAPHAIITQLDVTGPPAAHGVLFDALATGEGASVLLARLCSAEPVEGEVGRLGLSATPALVEAFGAGLAPRPMRFEQTNSTVPFGDRLILKVFRQLEAGVNAEIEVGAFLGEHAPRGLVPRLLGSISYEHEGAESSAVAVAHELVQNQGTAWDLFDGLLGTVCDRVLAGPLVFEPDPATHVLQLAEGGSPPASLQDLAGPLLRHARRLGQRTAEVHNVLATGTTHAFEPEMFTAMHQQSLFQGARALLVRTFDALGRKLGELPEELRPEVSEMLSRRAAIEGQLSDAMARPLRAMRIRCHGDYHLGQVLWTGEDFVVIDFEGEPARPLRERRYKRCPLRDVAGMLRSLSYAAEVSLRDGRVRRQDVERVRPWLEQWQRHAGAAFVSGYLEVIAAGGPADLLPPAADRARLLDFYVLEKCIYEISYELSNRPQWVQIPLRGLRDLLGVRPATGV